MPVLKLKGLTHINAISIKSWVNQDIHLEVLSLILNAYLIGFRFRAGRRRRRFARKLVRGGMAVTVVDVAIPFIFFYLSAKLTKF